MLVKLVALLNSLLNSFTFGYKNVLDQNQITLPYPVKEEEGRAQFDKSKRRLIVTVPVIPAPPVALNGHLDDEAAEHVVNGLVTEIVDDQGDCGLDLGGGDDKNGDDGVDENDCDVNNASHKCDHGIVENEHENVSLDPSNVSVNKDVAQEKYRSKSSGNSFSDFM